MHGNCEKLVLDRTLVICGILMKLSHDNCIVNFKRYKRDPFCKKRWNVKTETHMNIGQKFQ
jgi:uncharacterized CHY-type Zn-finger protein